ncbi:hypothetical protein [Agromyces sp. LHK192]|uniref:hypothetical protein n=1 Tax=Agromyces sp. LHK192 TaxID=2498704 RepID=UPI000FD8D9D6|nr:hypothetical protein [Agromyces sp. LHK192]
MHRIHYAGGELVTGDAIAEALIGLAAALARQHSAASVEIPVVGADGGIERAKLLLGPASQLVSEQLPGHDDLDDAGTVAGLRAEIALLVSHPIAEVPPPRGGDADPATVTGEYDWPEP